MDLFTDIEIQDAADRHEEYEKWVETHCRPSHPRTSSLAAEEMAPKVIGAQRRAQALLDANPGCTAAELEQIAGVSDGRIRKRLSDLRQKGLAKNGQVRTCSVTGRKAQTWLPA